MDEREMAETLVDILDELSVEDEFSSLFVPELEGNSVNTFAGAGLMTRNVGLVIELADGSKFQVTIVKER
jgi:hypothetical protein